MLVVRCDYGELGAGDVFYTPDPAEAQRVARLYEEHDPREPRCEVIQPGPAGAGTQQVEATVETIPEENKTQFWTIERTAGEALQAFVRRCWSEARGAPAERPLTPNSVQIETVREGYGSPYRFGRILRDLVGDGDAGVYAAQNVNTGRAVYYAWDGDNAHGNGPTRCAFYDPSRGPTWGQRPDATDWFAALDDLQPPDTCTGGQMEEGQAFTYHLELPGRREVEGLGVGDG